MQQARQEPNFKILNPTIHEARIACNELDFSVLDEVEEEPRFLETYSLQRLKRRRKKKKIGIFSKIGRAIGVCSEQWGKVGKFVVKNVAKVAKILPAAAIVFPPAAAAGAAARPEGQPPRPAQRRAKQGLVQQRLVQRRDRLVQRQDRPLPRPKAAAKDGGKVSILNKLETSLRM